MNDGPKAGLSRRSLFAASAAVGSAIGLAGPAGALAASENDGASPARLTLMSYQRDPRTSFIPMFDKMSKIDMLNQFVTHTGGGLFACPGVVTRGAYIGGHLFESA